MADRMTRSPDQEDSMTKPTRAFAVDADVRGEGICRTCFSRIWDESAKPGNKTRATGWSDRQSSDPLVCFKAINYAHVPLVGREAAIYDRAFDRGAASAEARA